MSVSKVCIETASSPAVYYPGSVIKGDVVIVSEWISQIRSIAINLSGKVFTHWIQDEHFRKRTMRITYEYSEDVLNVSLNNILPSTHASTQSTAELGHHKFPFTICLSENLRLPTSFEYTDHPPFMSDLSGHIRYMLTAKISVTSGRSYTAVKGVTVISNIDVNMPKLLRPLSSSKEKTVCCLCCASGPVSMTVSTDRGAYCSGESIRINVDTENHSTRRIVGIQASLRQTTLFYGNPVWNGWFRSLVLSQLPSERIYKTSKVIKTIRRSASSQNMSLPIPIIVPTIIECSGIKVFHTLDVFLVLRNALDLHVELPIVIGTIPLRELPNPTHASAGQLHHSSQALGRSNLKYAPASTTQVYFGLDAYTQGNLYYTPLYGYVENEVAGTHSN